MEKAKKEKYWSIVLKYVSVEVLAPFTIVVTPEIDDVFYNVFFDSGMEIDKGISEMFSIVKECNKFHDELTTDICFAVDWFYVKRGNVFISNKIDILPKALTDYYKHEHFDEDMRMY